MAAGTTRASQSRSAGPRRVRRPPGRGQSTDQPPAAQPVAELLLLASRRSSGSASVARVDQVVPGQAGHPQAGRRLSGVAAAFGQRVRLAGRHHRVAGADSPRRRRGTPRAAVAGRPGPAPIGQAAADVHEAGARPWPGAGRARHAACRRRRISRHRASCCLALAALDRQRPPRSRRRGRRDASGSARPCGSSGRRGRPRTPPGPPGRAGGVGGRPGRPTSGRAWAAPRLIDAERVRPAAAAGDVPGDRSARPGRRSGRAGSGRRARRGRCWPGSGPSGASGAASREPLRPARRSPGRRAGSRRGSSA